MPALSLFARHRMVQSDAANPVTRSDRASIRVSGANGSPILARPTEAFTTSQATAIGALSALDHAVDQFGTPKYRQS
jgi:hypothetical protein